MASKPIWVMRSAWRQWIIPGASIGKSQQESELLATGVWILAASPLIFVGSSTSQSSPREAADR